MDRSVRFRFGFLLLLVGVLLACAWPQTAQTTHSPPSDLAFTQTAVALQQTQVALQLTLQASSPTAAPVVATPSSPPPTAAVAASPTPAAAAATPTPTLAVSPTPTTGNGLAGKATGNLYCRTGPAPYYPAIDTMKAGDQVTVLARASSADDYWLVQTPQGQTCWVWGRWLDVVGDAAALPAATPPPAPPAAVTVRLLRQQTCWNPSLVFSVTNRGPKAIESIWFRITDLETGNIYETPPGQRDVFYYCSGQLDTLDPAQDTEVWVDLGGPDVQGHIVQVVVKTCTEEGLQGECIQRTPFNVKVP